MRRLVLVLLLLVSPALVARERLGPLFGGGRTDQARQSATPPLRGSDKPAPLLVTASGATESDLAELRAANVAAGPMSVGIVREVQPVAVAAAASDEPFRWRGSVRVEGARRVRVRLDGVMLPEGAKAWVYGSAGQAVELDRTLVHDSTLWTPSIDGDIATIEIDAPRAASFRIAAVADVRSREEVAAQGTECITDISCHTVDAALGRAIAYYEFIAGTRLLACTGGLLNNVKEDGTPYFLTANHCVKSQQQAATVETYWDYRSSACGAAAPALPSLARTVGATLLATSHVTDVTLLRLASVPPGRTFLGWDTRALDPGTPLFHISHPNGNAQRYSTSLFETANTACASSPRPSFLYSRPVIGATDVGSSGSPVLYGNGYVVGQLKAGCGPEPENACNRANYDVDGALAQSFPILEAYLDPPPVCAACTPDATTACMLGGRFKVTIDWRDPYINATGSGRPIRYAENTPQVHPEHGPIIESTFFAFYDFFPNSVETMVKMTKGVGINNRFWIFVTGFAGAEYTVNVQDTQTCATWQKTMPRDAVTAIRDYEAFTLP